MRRYLGWLLLATLPLGYFHADLAAWISPPPPRATGVEVTLFATEWCAWCAETRALLRRKGVAYREFDVEQSAEGMARFEQLKGRGVPVLVVGDEVIHGFNRRAMERALGRL